MSVPGCLHHPSCPTASSRWRCGQRTTIERAVDRDWITRAAGELLLRHYGLPMTAPSRVMTGRAPVAPKQGTFL